MAGVKHSIVLVMALLAFQVQAFRKKAQVGAADCGSAVKGAVKFGNHCQCPREGWIVADSDAQACITKLDKRTIRKFNPTDFAGLDCRCLYAGNDALPWDEHFKRYMADLKVTAAPLGFNPKCEPYVASPTGRFDTEKEDGHITSRRGLIVLTHGFTACANFWYLLEPRLVSAGWTVMVPNLVGHGRAAQVERDAGGDPDNATYTVTDYVDDMPTDYKQYTELSHEMIDIVRKYKDANPEHEIAIAGISLGGAVTTYMAMEAPELWDRVLLTNPFLAAPTGLGQDFGFSILAKLIPRVLPAFKKILPNGRVSWGDHAEQMNWPGNPAHGGHGGAATFSIGSFKALLQFSNNVTDDMRERAAGLGIFDGGILDRLRGLSEWRRQNIKRGRSGKHHEKQEGLNVQLLTAVNDGAISNGRVGFANHVLNKELPKGELGFCVFPQEFKHVWICPIDNLDRDHWWLDRSRTVEGYTAIDLLVNFLSDGSHVPAEKKMCTVDNNLLGARMCDLTYLGA